MLGGVPDKGRNHGLAEINAEGEQCPGGCAGTEKIYIRRFEGGGSSYQSINIERDQRKKKIFRSLMTRGLARPKLLMNAGIKLNSGQAFASGKGGGETERSAFLKQEGKGRGLLGQVKVSGQRMAVMTSQDVGLRG